MNMNASEGVELTCPHCHEKHTHYIDTDQYERGYAAGWEACDREACSCLNPHIEHDFSCPKHGTAQASECDHQWADYVAITVGNNPTLEIEACVGCGVQRKKQR